MGVPQMGFHKKTGVKFSVCSVIREEIDMQDS